MISPEALRRYPLFAKVDPVEFKDLAMLGEELTLENGDWLFEEGEDANDLYLLAKGTIDLMVNLDEEGTEKTELSTLVEGEVIGWSALVEPYVFTTGAVATSDATIYKLDARSMRRMMASNCEMGYAIMTQLSKVLGERLTNLRMQFVSLTVE